MNDIKYIVVKDQKTIARIYKSTQTIEVSPEFEKLSDDQKTFILTQLTFLDTKERDPFIYADDAAMQELVKKYPETNKKYWAAVLLEMFMADVFPYNELTYSRMSAAEKIINS